MEPRRIALAVVLMAAVLILTPILFPSPVPAPGSKTAVTDSLRLADSATVASTGSSTNPVVADSATVAAGGTAPGMSALPDSLNAAPKPVVLPVDTAVVTTTPAVFRTTNRGAALIGVEMQQYLALSNKGRTKGGPVELAKAGDRLLSFRLVTPGDTVALNTQMFTTTRTEENGRAVVRYDATVGARAITIAYSFLPDSYRVNVSAVVKGAPENSFLLIDMPPGFRSSESDTTEDQSHLAYAYKLDQQNAKGVAFRSLDPGERRIETGPINWTVAKNKYFLLGVLAPKGVPGFAEVNFTGGVRVAKAATRSEATIVASLKSGAVAFEVYAGPQEFKRLVAIGRSFETSNPYGGWLQGVVQPFATMVIRLLLWMKSTLGLSYGWILVVFGVAVRLILWPLNQKAMRSSMQMQRIQPHLAEIQTKYKGDPTKLQAEMMRVYKEHGMSPFSSLSGCLPMLIPLPVFFALFFVFQNTIEFRGVSFLWFPDISLKDPFFVLPVLVAITAMGLSYIGMRGMKANEQQKMMMYLMPAMMMVIFFNMASGLNLYYFVQNLASLPQQWLISQERTKAQPPVVRG
ncbi:membrane protein insertase YidC [Gemmatimonas groenlandica]|uniref:Membrane protein insertase YidC n=1 Tax=Gemmatimonas groenlandica TaxID=2732249 RepID=A0A6M4ITR6_9BACT|nr:membrane protein insertase YidC [Gemmatimonas groenlandica]QJR36866.1 membrane protein insertase YidC [Gemmatimonas groenlandica]